MYSLGVCTFYLSSLYILIMLKIVFFEMNFLFSTASERIAVIEDLRKPEIFFPTSWQPHLTRQKQSKYIFVVV
jgi:hypothetical protein